MSTSIRFPSTYHPAFPPCIYQFILRQCKRGRAEDLIFGPPIGGQPLRRHVEVCGGRIAEDGNSAPVGPVAVELFVRFSAVLVNTKNAVAVMVGIVQEPVAALAPGVNHRVLGVAVASAPVVAAESRFARKSVAVNILERDVLVREEVDHARNVGPVTTLGPAHPLGYSRRHRIGTEAGGRRDPPRDRGEKLVGWYGSSWVVVGRRGPAVWAGSVGRRGSG